MSFPLPLAPPNMPTRPLTSLHPRTAKTLLDARQRLLDSGTYLADPNFRDRVEWVRDGKSHKLVKKVDKPTPTSASAADDNDDDDDDSSAPEMAILSVIVIISSDDFWMSSDAGWRGPTKITKTFAQVKPSCTGEQPNLETLGDDFDTAISNLKWLQDQTATHGFREKKGLLVGNPGIPRIKVRHTLFEVSFLFLDFTARP